MAWQPGTTLKIKQIALFYYMTTRFSKKRKAMIRLMRITYPEESYKIVLYCFSYLMKG